MTRALRSLVPFLLGGAAPLAVHRIAGWWLNSGRGVMLMLVIVFALGVLCAIARPAAAWRSAGALSVGASAGSAALLGWIGAGTIWPIALVVAAALSTAAALAGAGVASLKLK
ncbi:MAG TPA: hypothetical protein VIC33_02505 [Vicinamibacterales bacterium]